MDHDAENKTELLPTLDAYLESGENLTHTARQLFIHLNTLRYRLKHISDITGIDLKMLKLVSNLAQVLRCVDI